MEIKIKTWKVALVLDITGSDLTYEKAFIMFTNIVLSDNHFPFRGLKVIQEIDHDEPRENINPGMDKESRD